MAHYIFFENATCLTSVLSFKGFWKNKCQTQEDVGSAGEQPTRNKIDAYTEKGVEHFVVQPLLFLVSFMSQKLTFCLTDRCTI